MPLNQFASISVHRNADSFAGFRRATLDQLREMNNDVAVLLCVDHPKFPNFCSIMSRHVQQATIADLSAHLCVKRRLIENDSEFSPCWYGKNRLHNRFGF
jgi:hypothetical protein